jgi:hypothetical protein
MSSGRREATARRRRPSPDSYTEDGRCLQSYFPRVESSGTAGSILLFSVTEKRSTKIYASYREHYRSSATDQDRQRHRLCLAIVARLFLARGAIKRAAITDCNPLDDRPAASAFFALAVVNAKVALKLAAFVVGGAVI